MNETNAPDVAALVLTECIRAFRKQKTLGERAITQLGDDELFATIDTEANSVAVLVKHLHGNMRSRWTDFLTSDGEKPDRDRDSEFIISREERTRAVVLQWWENGWSYVLNAVTALRPTNVQATVTIRGETMPVVTALLRQVDHYAQHVGQIVLLAKHLKGDKWQTLSIPRGKSAEVNAEFLQRAGAKAR
jgi:uncharacterized protein DUF1572